MAIPRFPDRLEQVMHPGVNQCRALIGDQKLIERDAIRFLPCRDAVDPINNLIDSRFTSGHTFYSDRVESCAIPNRPGQSTIYELVSTE